MVDARIPRLQSKRLAGIGAGKDQMADDPIEMKQKKKINQSDKKWRGTGAGFYWPNRQRDDSSGKRCHPILFGRPLERLHGENLYYKAMAIEHRVSNSNS